MEGPLSFVTWILLLYTATPPTKREIKSCVRLEDDDVNNEETKVKEIYLESFGFFLLWRFVVSVFAPKGLWTHGNGGLVLVSDESTGVRRYSNRLNFAWYDEKRCVCARLILIRDWFPFIVPTPPALLPFFFFFVWGHHMRQFGRYFCFSSGCWEGATINMPSFLHTVWLYYYCRYR